MSRYHWRNYEVGLAVAFVTAVCTLLAAVTTEEDIAQQTIPGKEDGLQLIADIGATNIAIVGGGLAIAFVTYGVLRAGDEESPAETNAFDDDDW